MLCGLGRCLHTITYHFVNTAIANHLYKGHNCYTLSKSNTRSLKYFLNLFKERSNLHQNVNYTGTRKCTKGCLSCYSEGNEEINYRAPKLIFQHLHFPPHNHTSIVIKAAF